MKQVYHLFVMVIALAIGIAVDVQSQTILSVDFSTAQGYTDGPIAGQPTGSDNPWINANPGVSTDSYLIENEMLSVIGDGVGGKWIMINMPVQKDVFTVEFEATYVGDGTMSNVGVSISDTVNFTLDGNTTPTYNEQGAMIRFAGSGILDVRDGDGNGGGSFTKLVDIAYNDGVKLYIREVIDALANLVTVYVQKEGEVDETLVAEDYGFRRTTSAETDGLNCITIFDNNSDASIPGVGIIFDNFLLYGGEGPTSVSEWSVF